MRHLSTCTPFLWFKLQIIIVIKCKCWGCRWNCVTPGNGGLGRLLEVCSIQQGSSSMSQPALLPYDPSAFWLLLPFFSAACFRHTSEAKWWVPLTKNYARIFFFLLELPLLCDLCALLNNAALEVMTALSLLLKPNLEGKRRKKGKTVWNWLSVEQRCKAYMWLLWSGRK